MLNRNTGRDRRHQDCRDAPKPNAVELSQRSPDGAQRNPGNEARNPGFLFVPSGLIAAILCGLQSFKNITPPDYCSSCLISDSNKPVTLAIVSMAVPSFAKLIAIVFVV